MRARALYDFVADAANGELSFREGDIIDVTNTEGGDGWWEGKLGSETGIFPENYVEAIPETEAGGYGTSPAAATGESSYGTYDAYQGSTSDYGANDAVVNRPTSLNRSDSQNSRFSVMPKMDEDVARAASIIVEAGPYGPRWQPRAEPLTIAIGEPEKRAKLAGIKEFVSYKVTSSTGAVVERRFKHFDWLHARIGNKFSVMVFGALPDKQMSGRFEEDFIERRRLALERYMNRLARHPVISQSTVFQHFLNCGDEKLWKAGKRAAERDTVQGRKLYMTVAAPTPQGKIDGDVDGTRRFIAFYKSFARDTTELIDAFEAFQLSTEGVRKQYNRLSLATGALIGRNQRAEHGALNDVGVWDSRKGVKECKGLTTAIGSVSAAYLEMAAAHGMVRKKMVEPFVDVLREYQSFMPMCANMMQTHQNMIQRVSEAHRLPDRGKELLARANQIFSTDFSEINRFHDERKIDFGNAFRDLLEAEIAHHQHAISILSNALATLDPAKL